MISFPFQNGPHSILRSSDGHTEPGTGRCGAHAGGHVAERLPFPSEEEGPGPHPL